MAWNKNVNTNAPSKSFIANLLKAGVAISGCAILFACGDDVTNENITQIVQENVVVVADVSKLPDCTSENEGQQALVKGEPSPRICVAGKWFATFSDYTDKLDDFKCSAEKLKDGSGLKILCNGDSIGVVLNGANGSNGVNGTQGVQGEKGDKGDTGEQGIQGEKGDKGDTGAQGIQGEKGDKGDTGEQGIQGEKGDKGDTGAQGIQGEKGDKGDKGEKGDAGEGCSIERNGSLITVTCGNQNAVINLNEIIANSNLGTCSSVNENEISQYENTYYICRSNMWVEASVLEYDTYGKTCSEDGSIVDGEVVAENKYTCDAGTFREAYDMEISLGKACVGYTGGEEIRKQVSNVQDSVYTCVKSKWEGRAEKHIYGMLLDERDQKSYKTTIIGEQVWMAENLNYNYNNGTALSYCYNRSSGNCTKYGRLYTWAAAMDSAEVFFNYGTGCGYVSGCWKYPIYPVRGVCPEGWHLPTKEEFEILIKTVGGAKIAHEVLKTTTGWSSGNGTDDYSFSALPGGYFSVASDGTQAFYNVGKHAWFWSSTYNSSTSPTTAYSMAIVDWSNGAFVDECHRDMAMSVRCVKD